MNRETTNRILYGALITWAMTFLGAPTGSSQEIITHPSAAQLALLKHGELSETEATAVHEHFANCQDCIALFAGMTASEEVAPAADHPSTAQLALLKHGELSEADATGVHEHFAHCPDCIALFAGMTASEEAAPAADHPSAAQLALLKHGGLSKAEATSVHEHFSHCPDCIARFSGVAAPDDAPPEVETVSTGTPAPKASSPENSCDVCRGRIIKLQERVARLIAIVRERQAHAAHTSEHQHPKRELGELEKKIEELESLLGR